MKPKTLLLLATTFCVAFVNAQKREKQSKPTTGFAVTAAEKGGRSWKEVKLVDVSTGEEVKSIFQSKTEVQPLNARTKKPIAKKEDSDQQPVTAIHISGLKEKLKKTEPVAPRRPVVNLDEALNSDGSPQGNLNRNVNQHARKVVIVRRRENPGMPFATNSAAMAYDKKHDRLYYTPMNIAQLRYIDLKSNQVYYFEDEQFGVVKGMGDVQKQITRMVIASDGNGYALTNDGNHLIRFTTGKKPVITDLGPLSDDAADAKLSIHSPNGFGGDMIADANGNLYLITANRQVFKISIASRVASYLGAIKGLPRGFSTNGAMVEEGSKVIVASAQSTEGYFRFDLNTLEAEKVSKEGTVFNVSDLANGNLAFEKSKKDKKQEPVVVNEIASTEAARTKNPVAAELYSNNISVYPNPVTHGTVKVAFNDLPSGKYQVQLLDLSGKLVTSQEVTVGGKSQVTDFNLPGVAKGSYLIKITSEPNKVSVTNKLVVQ